MVGNHHDGLYLIDLHIPVNSFIKNISFSDRSLILRLFPMKPTHTALAALSLAYLTSPLTSAAEQKIEDVNAKQASALIETNQKLVVLDVRTEMEFNGGHIKGANLIDATAPDFKAKVSKLDRQQSYLVHCASGGRSKNAIAIMKNLGFQNVYHLESGFNGWKAAGKPVTK